MLCLSWPVTRQTSVPVAYQHRERNAIIRSLLTEPEQLIDELNTLVAQVNQTNSRTLFDESRTLPDVLAERDAILLHRQILESVIQTAAGMDGLEDTDILRSSPLAPSMFVNFKPILTRSRAVTENWTHVSRKSTGRLTL